jgi:histone-lysine N-methyltransferase SETMAR
MDTTIAASASCEVHAEIHFLHGEGQSVDEIHCQLCRVYGGNVMSDSCVREWCRKFRDGHTDVHDEGVQGRHSIVTDKIVQKVGQCVLGKRRFTILELSEEFPQTSRTTLYRIVTDRLGYHKFCPRWVPKQLTDFHKTQRIGSALTFLQCYWEEGAEFLDRIVNSDETWVQFVNAEMKEQSKQWMNTHSPNKPKKFKQTLSNKKMMASVFWDRKGILLTELMAPGTTITSEIYCEMLNKLRRSIQNKQHGMLTKGVVLLHDNARPHTMARAAALIKVFNWEIFNHSPYSPDLASSNYHLFTKMKVWLATQCFHTNEELMDGVNTWLHNLADRSLTKNYKNECHGRTNV